mmetsp:Transcript_1689/g.5084  ORF Transcript_1689/g.5084 Transcript_1689/m.5084 type:complete len:186 (+) Transcript_1689:275-832(+)
MSGIDWGRQHETRLKTLPAGCVIATVRFLDQREAVRLSSAARCFIVPQVGLGAPRMVLPGSRPGVLVYPTLTSFCTIAELTVHYAWYGCVPESAVGDPNLWRRCRGKEVTARVRARIFRIDGHSELRIRARLNNIFGDSVRGRPKRLLVEYSYGAGRRRTLATPTRGGEKLFLTVTPTRAEAGAW